ncbi:tubulin-like doman-containing protein [Selenomonas sp. FC4001]|uniref:tubulin-like doman-containing protein n=1 Tax=Selenomonas sp. FC4001 TaxID=1408313 RepID=UPI00069222A8|nr:tubulin-like doman-containing protein [Selenomonas sp. FC4001]
MSYYFISIGGSGAKVMESLTHLCAAGLMPNQQKQSELYVMAIDPDIGNGNLKRSSAALHCLHEFQSLETGRGTPLFKTNIKLSRPFIWSPTETDKNLDDIMSYQAYRGTSIGKLYEVLYTQDERSTTLNEGFRGRPAIGAAVMAKKAGLDRGKESLSLAGDPAWDNLIHAVQQDVKNGQEAKIFLAGSVFGGTGAAGMPTVARLLRSMLKEYCDAGQARIGGALILPFFAFSPTEQEKNAGIYASSENFLTNTKAALKYYAMKDSGYDAMYFIGDNQLTAVDKFSIGAASQNNGAHMVDFYGAMAALDFYGEKTDSGQQCSYISHSDESSFQWSDLPVIKLDDGQEMRVSEALGQFARFIFAYVHLVKPVLADLASGRLKDYQYPWFRDFLAGLSIDTVEVRSFEEYAESFALWIDQLEHHSSNRRVEFINPNVFGSQPARLENPLQFSKLVLPDDSKVTMDELWHRLCEGKIQDEEYAQGFGRFLRLLYDSCAKV